ncbi:hypothetical protein EDD17DRAFT_1809844 [Pisolithus thermaeus]|nr:hypothetical protein EV401DRAFT_2073884 [Pisolithus croceorrhizus]KAI6163810.1 hypothetical protein EDD17DRAFT_1809844 [Pisolithus thermaeus]
MSRRDNPRSWSGRFGPLTPPTDSSTLSSESQAAGSVESNCPPDRVVHDSSIFVGCLPLGVDHAALAASLSEHLSQYSGIQAIKIVHDSKGGTCAFIRCQDPFSAATLLRTLRASTPRQFMGRYLRYEPARAFRILLISYRTPRQYRGNLHSDGTLTDMSCQVNSGEFVELDLPTAMKLIKTPGARRLTVLYNADALTDHGYETTSLLLDPLLYDADTLLRVATLFGPVEYFRPFKPVEDTSQYTRYPNPHSSPRSALMDHGCWEVKWHHRDDCVSAWKTLRKVPHLTVTWAHQSYLETHGQQQVSISDRASEAWDNHVVTRDDLSSPACPRFMPSFPDPPMNRDSLSHQVDLMPTLRVPSAAVAPDASIQQCRPRSASFTQPKSFRPLQPSEELPMPRRLALKNPPRGPLQGQQMVLSASNRSIMCSKTFTTLPSPRLSFSDSGDVRDADRRGIQSSPKFVAFPAPRETVGRRSPTPDNNISIVSSNELNRQLMQSPDNVTHDSTTIFVGGLRMSGPKAWVEGRIRALFSKYRGVKYVTVVRPANNRPGYAFVKFDNVESPLQAISNEHNRIVDGRRIRVQLRDLRPYRWRALRSTSGPEARVQGSDLSGTSTDPTEGSQDELMHRKIETSGVTKDMQATDSKIVSMEHTIPNFCPPRKVNRECHADHAMLEARGGHQALTDEAVSTPDEHQGPNDNTPPVAVDAFQTSATRMSSSQTVTGYSVPTAAYYHPQGWAPGFGPCPHPLLAPQYPGYQVVPQLIPPFPQGTSVDGSQSTPESVPLSGFESGSSPYIPFPHVVGYALPDGSRSGTAATPPNYHVPAALPPPGFNPGYRCPPYFASDAQSGEVSFTPGNETSSSVTRGPYPHMQPPSVFFQPFPQPLPYPTSPLGPNLWFANHSWHEEMLHPSSVQDLPRLLVPPSAHDVNVESKFRNHLPRRQHRREGQAGYHRNSQSLAPVGR